MILWNTSSVEDVSLRAMSERETMIWYDHIYDDQVLWKIYYQCLPLIEGLHVIMQENR